MLVLDFGLYVKEVILNSVLWYFRVGLFDFWKKIYLNCFLSFII